MSKLDDINYLINLIYEHLYQKIPSIPIESKPISTNYIDDLSIVKKMYTGSQLKELVNMVFNTNLSYIGRGESGFKFKRLDSPSTDIILRQYNKDQELNPSNSLNVDKIIAYLLSDLVVHKKTQGILVNICNMDIPMKDLELFIKKYPEIKFTGSNQISITIREHFYKLVSLKDFLIKDSSTDKFKSCIFQVFHTLDIIQSMYPTFRHNNLTISTIMVYETNDKTIKLKVGSTEFTIKSTGETKITNFLNSNMKDYITNDSLEPKMQEPNKIYDVEMFLDSLMELELPKEIKEFVKRNSDKTPRDILLSDPLFKNIDQKQLGGKRKKSKKNEKYSMTQEEVDKILSIDLVEDIQVKDEPIKDILEPSQQALLDPVQQILKDLESKTNVTEFGQEQKFPQKPINIPGTNIQLKQAETTNPIIKINLPDSPPLEPNSFSSLMGSPNRPTSGIMNTLAPPIRDQVLTLNVITDEKKEINKNIELTDNGSFKLVGGAKKKKKSKKSRRASMSQEEFESIMNSDQETPVEQTVNSLKNQSLQASQPQVHQPRPQVHQPHQPQQPQNMTQSGSISSKLKQITDNNSNNDFSPPLNVIPNPFKNIGEGAHSILGLPEQRGGADRIIPRYKGIKHSPYTPNETKRIQRESYYEQNPGKEQEEKQERQERPDRQERDYAEPNPRKFNSSKSVFELKIAPELLPQQPVAFPKAQPDQIVKNYILPATGQPINQNEMYSIPNQIGQINQKPEAHVLSQNTYNISFANPFKIREFREDILPGKDESMLKYTMNTISERMIIYNYLRSILIRQNDGENINFISDKSPEVRNLLSYLRIIDIQLAKNDKITNNPLGDLPRRLVMYNSCYPIRVDRTNYNVGCAKNNIGINIRIYQLIMGETFVNKYRSLPYKVFEVWREISLYEQLRDNIIKSNISPNFGILYAYYITKDTEIDFLKINRLRKRDIVSKQEKEQKKTLNDLYKNEMQDYLVGLQKYSTSDLTKLVNDLDIHKPSDKCLIALTEAGTHDLISWSSRQYEDNGLAKKMINTGYHATEVWQSILFQMFQSFLCMYKNGISFQTFDLNSNVMIKSLKTDEINKGFWKYIINGIEFYVPNYGYMVLITPDFSDIKSNDEQTLAGVPIVFVPPGRTGLGLVPPAIEDTILEVLDNNSIRKLDNVLYKCYSNELLINQSEININKNRFRTISNMKDAFNEKVFNKEYTLNGGVQPDPSIMKIIQDINQDLGRQHDIAGRLLDIAKKAQVECIRNQLSDDETQEVIRLAISTAGPAPLNTAVADAAVTAKIALYITARNTERAAKVAEAADPVPTPATVAARAAADAAKAAADLNPSNPYIFEIKNNLMDLLLTKFKSFLHNRVGTSIKDGELANLSESDTFEVGELVGVLGNKRWGIITQKIDDVSFKVYTVDSPAGIDNNILSKLKSVDYNIGDLRRSTVILEQISKPNHKLSDNDLLETYNLSLDL
jgi:hypothetical protein